MGICVLGDGMFTTAWVWRTENKLALLFHQMGPRDQTWVIRLSGKKLSPAERLAYQIIGLTNNIRSTPADIGNTEPKQFIQKF